MSWACTLQGTWKEACETCLFLVKWFRTSGAGGPILGDLWALKGLFDEGTTVNTV